MKVEIFSDVVCPWCYIGERRFTRALEGFERADELEVVMRPYQLDPDAPVDAMPHLEYMERRYGQLAPGMLRQVSGIAADEGIAIDWDAALAANTRSAHRLLGLAEREYGSAAQLALADKFFALHFSEGGDIGDPAQLADAAAAAGLERERVVEYLAGDEGAAELDADLERAHRMGIRAVPTFVLDDKWLVQGAQPSDVFRQALEEVMGADAG